MKIEKDDYGNYILTVSSEEMLIFNNALNEICNGIDVPEFETRIGVPIEKVREALKQIGASLS